MFRKSLWLVVVCGLVGMTNTISWGQTPKLSKPTHPTRFFLKAYRVRWPDTLRSFVQRQMTVASKGNTKKSDKGTFWVCPTHEMKNMMKALAAEKLSREICDTNLSLVHRKRNSILVGGHIPLAPGSRPIVPEDCSVALQVERESLPFGVQFALTPRIFVDGSILAEVATTVTTRWRAPFVSREHKARGVEIFQEQSLLLYYPMAHVESTKLQTGLLFVLSPTNVVPKKLATTRTANEPKRIAQTIGQQAKPEPRWKLPDSGQPKPPKDNNPAANNTVAITRHDGFATVQLKARDGIELTGKADRIAFDSKSGTLVLIGKAVLQEVSGVEIRRIKAERMQYSVRSGHFKTDDVRVLSLDVESESK